MSGLAIPKTSPRRVILTVDYTVFRLSLIHISEPTRPY